ncbi:MAG TPA: preprotein translocase subunit SecE [Gemmataceae bacterium]|nr:preprotein translocase subunit SecE [Gemmataceae bacterium]
MSVAENTVTQPPVTQAPQQELAVGSFVGAAGLLFSFFFIFGLVPLFWSQAWAKMWASSQDMVENVFLMDTLLLLLDAVIIAGFAYGVYTVSQRHTKQGLRAGVFFAVIYLSAVFIAVGWLGNQLEQTVGDNAAAGWGILAVTLAVFVGLAVYVYLMVPGWRAFLETFEQQGWFHAIPYKGNQGVRVRRGTIVGILAVGITGVITMVTHRWFGYERPEISNDFAWRVPFTNPLQPAEYITFMYKVHLILPVILGIALIWLAWRIVNLPTFADFLIATEAEMNKVSWTTRKRLMQDTVVVLTTVILMTAFLFIVDIVWIKVLSARYVEVLLIDPREQAQKQQEVAKW